MGGIRKYQDASVFDYSFRKYRPDKWVIEKLIEYKIKPKDKSIKVIMKNNKEKERKRRDLTNGF